jgi:hypothetical protein
MYIVCVCVCNIYIHTLPAGVQAVYDTRRLDGVARRVHTRARARAHARTHTRMQARWRGPTAAATRATLRRAGCTGEVEIVDYYDIIILPL